MADRLHEAASAVAVDGSPPSVAPPAELDQQLKGIGYLVLGITLFSLQDLIIKLLSDSYPIHQALTIRSLTALPVLLLLVALDGGLRSLASARLPALLGRGAIMFLSYTSYYLALAALPLATCVALYFTAPLFITALSVVMLGEKVGPRRWGAVIAGFIGVFIMVRPGTDAFDWASVLPVAAALAYGFAQILARRLGRTERATVMGFYGNGVYVIGGPLLALIFAGSGQVEEQHQSLLFLTRDWAMPSLRDLLLMMSCGLIAAVGLVLLTAAYRVAQANTVAPFEYTALLWGILYGWIFWQDLPSPLTWLGIAIVIGAGLYVLYRERRTGAPTLWPQLAWSRLRRNRKFEPRR